MFDHDYPGTACIAESVHPDRSRRVVPLAAAEHGTDQARGDLHAASSDVDDDATTSGGARHPGQCRGTAVLGQYC